MSCAQTTAQLTTRLSRCLFSPFPTRGHALAEAAFQASVSPLYSGKSGRGLSRRLVPTDRTLPGRPAAVSTGQLPAILNPRNGVCPARGSHNPAFKSQHPVTMSEGQVVVLAPQKLSVLLCFVLKCRIEEMPA